MAVYIKSPAKVNLHLEIINKRKDGYHNLVSVVQFINLYDEIIIDDSDYDSFQCSNNNIKDNIVIKAVKVFRKYTGIKKPVKINLKKEIPVGAGLGGGSGNAASVLVGLNKLFGSKIKYSELIEISKDLGSDIPLFFGSPAAIISKKGEIIEPLKPRKDFELILISPAFSISTKSAYELWDGYSQKYTGKSNKIINLKDMYEKDKIEQWQFFNSFGKVIEKKYPEIYKIKQMLITAGAVYADISGSGSSVFGVFNVNNIKNYIISEIKSKYSYTRLIKMLDRSIKPVLK